MNRPLLFVGWLVYWLILYPYVRITSRIREGHWG